MFTDVQKKTLDFINNYTRRKGYSPTQSEIAKHFKKSLSSINERLQKLEEVGKIRLHKNQRRGVEILDTVSMVQIPLLGTIAAGQPIEAIEEKETVAVAQNKLPFTTGSNYYALRVVGNSMIDENINDGDIVLVKEQATAENGQKVVALIDNYEATLKKFYKEEDSIRLQPANKELKPIIVKNDRSFSIRGIVVDVIKDTELESPVSIKPVLKERKNKLPLNQIICGDAIKELRKLPDESVDIIIADPPYNIGKDFGNNIDKRDLVDYIRWSNSWISECIRVMKPTATIYIYGFSEILAHISVEITLQKRWLIWHYTNKNVASYNFWQRSHESIICAWKNKPVFNRDEVREPYTEGFLNGAAGKIRKGTTGRFSKDGKETVYNAHEKGALPRDVLKIPALAGGAGMSERWFLCKTCDKVCEPQELKKHKDHEIMKHPTQKPFELTKRLIKSATPKNEGVVLIPFVGSGSECLVAKQLGKNYIGFELNPEYVELAQEMVKRGS